MEIQVHRVMFFRDGLNTDFTLEVSTQLVSDGCTCQATVGDFSLNIKCLLKGLFTQKTITIKV